MMPAKKPDQDLQRGTSAALHQAFDRPFGASPIQANRGDGASRSQANRGGGATPSQADRGDGAHDDHLGGNAADADFAALLAQLNDPPAPYRSNDNAR